MLFSKLISFTTLATLGNAASIPRSKQSQINFKYEYTWSKEPDAAWRQNLNLTNSYGKELHHHQFEKDHPGCTAEGQTFKVTSSCWSDELVFKCTTNKDGNIELCQGNEEKGAITSEDVHLDKDVIAHHNTCAGSVTLKDERCNPWDTFRVEIKDDGSRIERQTSFTPIPYNSAARQTERLQQQNIESSSEKLPTEKTVEVESGKQTTS